MLVGALALDVLGDPRSTHDVDLQVRLDDPPERWASTWEGWFIQERAHDEVFDQATLVLQKPTETTPFELSLTSHWFTTQALNRRQQVRLERLDRDVPVPTPEDFVRLKACYWSHESRRKAKAAQDAVDIESVFLANRQEIDGEYLEDNARQLGTWPSLSDLLDLS